MEKAYEIREARERAGLTQEALGALLGVSMRTVGNWERGQTVPLNRLAKIREVLAGHWKDDESADSVGLSNASDVELLAEIARRFARTTEKAGESGATSTSPMNQAGDDAGITEANRGRLENGQQPVPNLAEERRRRDQGKGFGHRDQGDLDHENTGTLRPPPSREDAAAYEAPNRGAEAKKKQDRDAEDESE